MGMKAPSHRKGCSRLHDWDEPGKPKIRDCSSVLKTDLRIGSEYVHVTVKINSRIREINFAVFKSVHLSQRLSSCHGKGL
jgi:hypothetical protein